MDAERWQRLSPMLDALFELEDAERAQRLRDLRIEDPTLADELEELIALDDADSQFFDQPLVAPMHGMRPGSVVGPYRLERMLGEGGMGQVWLASRADGLYQRRVALKLLRPGLADPNLRLRFTRERQILARLAHPHIARLLDAGISSDNLPYLALEYVEGEPITDYCRTRDVPVTVRLDMFRQICDAVSHAHANLIVHRDLKPSNILVTPGGEVRLLDFGIAKLLDSDAPMVEQTRTGMRAFTLHYAAPEQVRGEPVTTMTDVYSLGVVLYELLTDAKPYRLKRNTDAEWEEAILAVDPLRPSQTVLRREDSGGDRIASRRLARCLAGDLDNIVLKTLSKRPEKRYPSVEALALDLERFGNGRPVLARPQSVGYRMRKYMRRHRWALATGMATTFVLGIALAIVAWQAREALHEATRAQAMQDFMVGLFEHAGGGPDGRPLDLRELLDAAVERGERELERQPRARAELLGVVARLRTGLGDYREASALLDRQARIIGGTEGIPVSLELEALAQRGEVLRRLGQPKRCAQLMQPALDTARGEQARLPTQASEFYSQLGRCRRELGDRQQARQLFERALALRREDGVSGIAAVESRLDLAALKADAGEVDDALRRYEAARTQLREKAGERHPLLVGIGRSVAALHRRAGRPREAEEELRNALAVALDANGALHPATLATRRELADVLAAQGRYAQAQQELAAVQGALRNRRDTAVELRESHRNLARVQWQRGALDEAEASLRAALALGQRAGDTRQIVQSLTELAELLHQAGKDEEAAAQAARALALLAEVHAPPSVDQVEAERVTGEIEAMQGLPTARAHLATARDLALRLSGRDAPSARHSELALARFDALHGDRRALARLDALSTQTDGASVAGYARAYALEARCAAREAGALRRFDALGRELARREPEGSALTREVDRLHKACEARQGDVMARR